MPNASATAGRIEKNKTGYGWGPQKWDEAAPGYKKFQIWIDSTNFD
jgi:hypothetical protein